MFAFDKIKFSTDFLSWIKSSISFLFNNSYFEINFLIILHSS